MQNVIIKYIIIENYF